MLNCKRHDYSYKMQYIQLRLLLVTPASYYIHLRGKFLSSTQHQPCGSICHACSSTTLQLTRNGLTFSVIVTNETTIKKWNVNHICLLVCFRFISYRNFFSFSFCGSKCTDLHICHCRYRGGSSLRMTGKLSYIEAQRGNNISGSRIVENEDFRLKNPQIWSGTRASVSLPMNSAWMFYLLLKSSCILLRIHLSTKIRRSSACSINSWTKFN